MNLSGPDVNDTLEYRTATEIVRLLPTGLMMIFLGLFVLVLMDPERAPVAAYVGIPLAMATGCAVIGVALWTRASPGKPLFTLSPAGIHYRIPWVKEFLIPWREIQGVDTIDIVTTNWRPLWLFISSRYQTSHQTTAIFRNVTVVLVSKQFYDTQIFVGSFFLRGPGWKANFIPKGALVQTALHHELVSVEPQALRQAVEARWHAFRDQTADEPTRTSVPAAGHSSAQTKAASDAAPKSNIVAMGDSPRAISKWEAVKIIVPLIGIAFMLANLVGLWRLPGQGEETAASVQAREERKYWEESNRRMLEERKLRDAAEKERQKNFDDTMRSTFGR